MEAAHVEEPVATEFEEVTIRGETFVLVPKNVSNYVPTTPAEIQHIEGIVAVEVGSNYTYIPTSILPKVASLISKSIDLQQEVAGCRYQLWTRYGKKVSFHHLIQICEGNMPGCGSN